MFISYQLRLSSQRKCQQESAFLQPEQQSNPINNFPFYLTNFHLFFIGLFGNYLESFSSRKIVDSLTFANNTNNFFQTFRSKSSTPQFSMLSSLFKPFQSLIEIHLDFYDPIGIQLERKFQENEILIKLLTITVNSTYRVIFLSSIRFVFLLLTFELYIYMKKLK